MERAEWTPIAYTIDALWPATKFEKAHEDAYFDLLKDYEVSDVEAVVREMLDEGSPFAPSAGQLLVGLRGLHENPVPTFEQAWEWVELAARRLSGNQRAAIHFLSTKHEYVANWAAQYGWERLRLEPVHDPDTGGAAMHRLRSAYNGFIDGAEKRQRRERIRTQLNGRVGEPRHLRPVGVQELEPPETS